MRPGEYQALQWGDIDLQTGSVIVRRAMEWLEDGSWRIAETKTAKSRRAVILPKSLLPMLRDHRVRQLKERLAAGSLYEDHGFVFASYTGGPVDRRNLLQRHLRPALLAAGLPASLRLYDLRHGCATLLLAAGTNPKIVAERLGHASTTMTMDVYSHVTPTMQQDAENTLEAMMFPPSRTAGG